MARTKRPFKRRNKIPKPALQLKMVGVFLGFSALSFLLYTLMLGMRVSELAARIPSGGEYVQEELPMLLAGSLLQAFVVLLPLIFLVGVAITFKVAGPVFRLERHLERVARGEKVDPVRLRDGDELNELADCVNAAVAAVGMERTEDEVDDEDAGDGAAPELRRAG